MLKVIKIPKLTLGKYQNCLSYSLFKSDEPAGVDEQGFSERERQYQLEQAHKDEVKPERRLREWRKPFRLGPNSKGETKMFFSDRDDSFFRMFQTDVQFTPDGLRQWWVSRRIKLLKEDQEYIAMRHEILGSDLATAHFVTYRGGAVKFKDHTEWIRTNPDKKSVNLPQKFHPDYVLTHVDASGIELYYEGLENFTNLHKLIYANFSKNPALNDWHIDKIANLFPSLEHLDISCCPQLTELGLEGLYKLQSLNKLVVTNYSKKPEFELTCLMLEDCISSLQCEILEPENQQETSAFGF